jgi:hypothetical protein
MTTCVTKSGYVLHYLGLQKRYHLGRSNHYHLWRSHCVDCGAVFEQTTHGEREPDLRRCKAHRGGIKRNRTAYPQVSVSSIITVQ